MYTRDRSRPHHDRAQLQRRGVRPGAAAARRHLRRGRRVPPARPRRERHRRGHRPGHRRRCTRARGSELPESRRGAGVRRAATRPPSSWRASIFDRVAAAIRAGDLGADARATSRACGSRCTSRTSRRRRTRAGSTVDDARRPKALLITFLVPGPLDARTGGYEYDRRMVAGAAGARAGPSSSSRWTPASPTRRRQRAHHAAQQLAPGFPTARS